MNELRTHWKRIVVWMTEHAPEALEALSPPASPHAVDALERALGVALPAGYRAWLALHDGERRPRRGIFTERLLGTADIERAWRVRIDAVAANASLALPAEQVDAAIDPVWLSPRWIPVTDNLHGDALCLDLDPTPAGRIGQIIRYSHDSDVRRVRAVSFEALLCEHADALENGTLVATEEPLGREFFGIVERGVVESRLSDLYIHGESEEAARARRLATLRANPGEAASRLVELLTHHGWLSLRPAKSVAATLALTRVFDDTEMPSRERATLVHQSLVALAGFDALSCAPSDIERALAKLADPDRFQSEP